MTRIVAGEVGGRTLVVPKGDTTRPTSERVREALFAGLESRGLVAGAQVLDLFTGSGALGLEAASRGAASVTLVDSARNAVTAARANVTALGLTSRVTVVLSSVERYLAQTQSRPYGLVLADPPYGIGEGEVTRLLELLAERGWLAPNARVVLERSARSVEPRWAPGQQRYDVRRHGDTTLWFAQWSPVPSSS